MIGWLRRRREERHRQLRADHARLIGRLHQKQRAAETAERLWRYFQMEDIDWSGAKRVWGEED